MICNDLLLCFYSVNIKLHNLSLGINKNQIENEVFLGKCSKFEVIIILLSKFIKEMGNS